MSLDFTAIRARPGMLLLAVPAYLALSLVLVLYYCRVPPSPDQSLFDYMAWLDLHGVPFYSGSFDMTWPGQLVIHELGVLLFGVHAWTSRLTDFLYMQMGVAALVLFARAFDFRRAAWLMLFAYPVVYVTSGWWMAGHRDLIATHWIILAAAIMGRNWRSAILVGLCCGYAVATRPTYLSFAPMIVIADGLMRPTDWRTFWRQTFGVGIGVGIVVAAFVIIGIAQGSLGAWWEDSIGFVTHVYSIHRSLGEMLAGIAGTAHDLWWLICGAAVGTFLLVMARGWSLALARIVVLFAVVMISYFAQNKGFGYHLGGLVPLTTLLAAIGIDLAIGGAGRTSTRALAYGAVAAVLVAFSLAGLATRVKNNVVPVLAFGVSPPRNPERDAMAAIIRAESAPGDRVYQFGWNYDVIFLAQRYNPTFLVNTTAINEIDGHSGPFTGWIDRMRRDLRTHPPRFLLIDTHEWPGMLRGESDTMARAAIVDALRNGYRVRASTPTMVLYERASLASTNAPQPSGKAPAFATSPS